MTRAAALMEQGRWEEAAALAAEDIERDPDDPEPRVERAAAYAALEKWPEALADLERALDLDRTAEVLEDGLVDDALFDALLGLARREAPSSLQAATGRLARYRELFPAGRHVDEASEWTKRLRGELPAVFVKRRLEDLK